MQRRLLPEGWDADIPEFPADPKGKASRDSSGTGAQRDRATGAMADRRRRGPCSVYEDAPDVRRCR